jgi:enterochelin esterase-like enzyme
MKFSHIFLLFSFLFVAACTEKPRVISKTSTKGLEILEIFSPAIAQNQIDENPNRLITVYLPPSYRHRDRDYPVVYYLHGWNESPMSIARFVNEMNEFFTENPRAEFVLVGIDGCNQLGGTWWVDSSVTGMWETFATKEIPQIISDNYRVCTERASTGIAGFSMGGFAALNFGLKYGDRYGSVWAIAPNATLPEDMSEFLHNDSEMRFAAKVAAFLPELIARDLMGPLDSAAVLQTVGPPDPGTEVTRYMAERWGAQVWEHHIEANLEARRPIPTLYFEIGDKDRHREYFRGLEQFSLFLDENDIPYTYTVFSGGHAVTARFGASLLPFYRGVFKTP